MVNVAIAGGTGGVGRTIFEVLSTSKHTGFVLSRKVPILLSLPISIPLDAYCIQWSSEFNNVLPVDYSNIDHLVSVLEANQIDTVISAFAVEGDSLAMAQLNLIEAATRSKSTRRFIPSAFAIPYPEE